MTVRKVHVFIQKPGFFSVSFRVESVWTIPFSYRLGGRTSQSGSVLIFNKRDFKGREEKEKIVRMRETRRKESVLVLILSQWELFALHQVRISPLVYQQERRGG